MRFLSLIFTIYILLFAGNIFANLPHSQLVLEQNQTYNFAEKDWMEKIKISGLIMGEAIFSNHDEGSTQRFGRSKHYSTFCFPRASLYIDANVNEYTRAHLALNFAPSQISSTCSACGFGKKNDELRLGKYDKIDESYITFSDLTQSPYYARVGIQYVPYGYYARNNIPATLTQLLTQTQAAAVTAGYVNSENGLNFAIYSFSGKNKRSATTKINNWGGQIGYIKEEKEENSLVTLGWINNIANSVNYIVSSTNCCGNKEHNELNKGYRKVAPGISLTLQHKTSKWDATFQVTSALSKFNSSDIMWKTTGAKPKAGLIDAGYYFDAFEKKNRIGVSYQMSAQAVNIKGNDWGVGLPKQRIQGDYTIELLNNLELGAHVFWDKDYSKNQEGTGKSATTMLLTMSVKLG